jgi:hypothetical protein
LEWWEARLVGAVDDRTRGGRGSASDWIAECCRADEGAISYEDMFLHAVGTWAAI